MEHLKTLSKNINSLITYNIDAHKLFLDTANAAEKETFSALLKKMADTHRILSQELTAELKVYNPEASIDFEGSLEGALQRGWSNLKSSITLNDDKAILAMLIDAEIKILESYIKIELLSATQKLEECILHQKEQITKSIDELKKFQELY